LRQKSNESKNEKKNEAKNSSLEKAIVVMKPESKVTIYDVHPMLNLWESLFCSFLRQARYFGQKSAGQGFVRNDHTPEGRHMCSHFMEDMHGIHLGIMVGKYASVRELVEVFRNLFTFYTKEKPPNSIIYKDASMLLKTLSKLENLPQFNENENEEEEETPQSKQNENAKEKEKEKPPEKKRKKGLKDKLK